MKMKKMNEIKRKNMIGVLVIHVFLYTNLIDMLAAILSKEDRKKRISIFHLLKGI